MLRFTSKENKADFPLVQFVAKARIIKGAMEFGVNLFYTGGFLYGTDGHRLHRAEVTLPADGLYGVIKATKSEIILSSVKDGLKWPEHFSQITDIKYDAAETVLLVDTSESKDYGPSGNMARISRAMPTNAVKSEYLRDATEIPEPVARIINGENPIMISNDKCTAWVMPFKLSE